MVRHPGTGKYRRTRLFVFTLGFSRKSVRLLTFASTRTSSRSPARASAPSTPRSSSPHAAPAAPTPRRRESNHRHVPDPVTLSHWLHMGDPEVYVQVVVDVFCSLAFAKVYTSKMPMTACDLLYDRVLPFYEALGVAIGAVLTACYETVVNANYWAPAPLGSPIE